MKLFAIGDLHLSGFTPKPMNIFGDHWDGHWDKIRESWNALVSDDDVVLVPGDLSWAMKLNEAAVDIDEICAMPGKKVIMKGNHDYWWNSLSQVNSLLKNQTYALQNNSFVFGDYVITGTRGWIFPGFKQYNPEKDEKLYLREASRLALSLEDAVKKAPNHTIICMMHYPPSDQYGNPTKFTDLFDKYHVSHVVYGHLHSGSIRSALSGNVRGVEYHLVSSDALDFYVYRLA